MHVKVTAWIEGEYIDSDVVFIGETLEELFKQICIKNGTTFFEILSKDNTTINRNYLIKINSKRLHNLVQDVLLQPNDHVVVVYSFRFAAGG